MSNRPHGGRSLTVGEFVNVLRADDAETLRIGLERACKEMAQHLSLAASSKRLFTEDYLDNSPDAADLLALWTVPLKEVALGLDVVLLRTVELTILLTHTPLLRSKGIALCRTIVRSHLRFINHYLGLVNNADATAGALRLVAAINTQGVEPARELQESFTFTLKQLSRHISDQTQVALTAPLASDATDPLMSTVRGAYIRFVMSFFVASDVNVKKAVLEIKGFVFNLIRGFKDDPPEVIQRVLEMILDYIVMDPALSRTSKLSLLSPIFLEKLADLYNRLDSTTEEIVHNFLLQVCTKPGQGVCFQDAGWYQRLDESATNSTDGKKKASLVNKQLLRFMHTLAPGDDLWQQSLILAILAACPELVRPYWHGFTASGDPRLSLKWLAHMSLAFKTTLLPVPSLRASQAPAAATVIDNICNPWLTRTLLSHGLQSTNGLVKRATLQVLDAVMRKLAMVLQALEPFTDGSSAYSDERTDDYSDLRKSIRLELKKRLPDIQIVLALHAQLRVSDSKTDSDVKSSLLYQQVVTLIASCQRFLPEALLEARFDFTKVLPTSFISLDPALQFQITRLLHQVAPSYWTKQGQLVQILALFTETTNPALCRSLRLLLHSIFQATFVFDGNTHEITAWIDPLPANAPGALHQFLDAVIAKAARTPYHWLEKTGQLFATTQEGCKNLSALHTYLAQSPFLFLGPKVALPPAPFSALLLCAFDVHRQMAAKDPSNLAEIEHYLTKLVKTIARSTQLTPVYLRAAVAQHFSVAPARLDPLLQWLDCILAPKKDPATAAGDTLGSVFETLLASPGALLLSADAVNALADRVLATLELLPAGGDLHLYLVVNLVNLVTSVLHVISEYHEKVSRPALQRLLTLVEAVAVRHSLNGVDIVLHHPIFMKTLDRQGDHRPSTTVIRLALVRMATQTARVQPPLLLDAKGLSVLRPYRHPILSRLLEAFAADLSRPTSTPPTTLSDVASLVALTMPHLHRSDAATIVSVLAELPDNLLLGQASPYLALLLDGLRTLVGGDSKAAQPQLRVSALRRLFSLCTESGQLSSNMAELERLLVTLVARRPTVEIANDGSIKVVPPVLLAANEMVLSACLRRPFSTGLIGIVASVASAFHLGTDGLRSAQRWLLQTLGSIVPSLAPAELPLLAPLMALSATRLVADLGQHLSCLNTGAAPPPTSDLTVPVTSEFLVTHGDILFSKLMDAHKLALNNDPENWAWTGAELAMALQIALQSPKLCQILEGSLTNVLDASPLWLPSNSTPSLLAYLMKRWQTGWIVLAQALVQQIDPKSPLRSRLWLRICGDLRMLFTNSDSSTAAGIEAMGLDLLETRIPAAVDTNDITHFEGMALALVNKRTDHAHLLHRLARVFRLLEDRCTSPEAWEQLAVSLASTIVTAPSPKYVVQSNRPFQLSGTTSSSASETHLIPSRRVLCLILGAAPSRGQWLDQRTLAQIALAYHGTQAIEDRAILHLLYRVEADLGRPVTDALFQPILKSAAAGEANSSSISVLLGALNPQYVQDTISSFSSTSKLEPASPVATCQEMLALTPAQVLTSTSKPCYDLTYLLSLLCGLLQESALDLETQVAEQQDFDRLHPDIVAALNVDADAGNYADRGPSNGLTDEDYDEALKHGDLPTRKRAHFAGASVYSKRHRRDEPQRPLIKLKWDVRALIDSQVFAIVVTCLSGTDPALRRAAAIVVGLFYRHVEFSDMREQKQVKLLLDSFRSGITLNNLHVHQRRPETDDVDDDKMDTGEDAAEGIDTGDQPATVFIARVPSAIPAFVIQALNVILHPDNILYPLVNRFLLQRPALDVKDLPMFYSLFYSGADTFKQERQWILRLLAASLKVPSDYGLFKRRHAMDILLTFYDSPLSDELANRYILSILAQSLQLVPVGTELLRQHGLLHWLLVQLQVRNSSHAVLIKSKKSAQLAQWPLRLAIARLCLRALQLATSQRQLLYNLTAEQFVAIAGAMINQASTYNGESETLPWAAALVQTTIDFVLLLPESPLPADQVLELCQVVNRVRAGPNGPVDSGSDLFATSSHFQAQQAKTTALAILAASVTSASAPDAIVAFLAQEITSTADLRIGSADDIVRRLNLSAAYLADKAPALLSTLVAASVSSSSSWASCFV